jgi:hypothetical protein
MVRRGTPKVSKGNSHSPAKVVTDGGECLHPHRTDVEWRPAQKYRAPPADGQDQTAADHRETAVFGRGR